MCESRANHWGNTCSISVPILHGGRQKLQANVAATYFPKHIQAAERQTTHITAFASDCFPNVPILQAHMGEELLPTWNMFFCQNTEQFERWLKQWKLPSSLIQLLGRISSGSVGSTDTAVFGVESQNGERSSDMPEAVCGIACGPLSSFFDITLPYSMAVFGI